MGLARLGPRDDTRAKSAAGWHWCLPAEPVSMMGVARCATASEQSAHDVGARPSSPGITGSARGWFMSMSGEVIARIRDTRQDQPARHELNQARDHLDEANQYLTDALDGSREQKAEHVLGLLAQARSGRDIY